MANSRIAGQGMDIGGKNWEEVGTENRRKASSAPWEKTNKYYEEEA